MPIKVKIGGVYADAAPFVKRGGVYAAAVASVKAGGVYSLVSGEPVPSEVIAPVFLLVGQSLNAARGTTVDASTDGAAFMPAGGASVNYFQFYATNALWTAHWSDVGTAVSYAEGAGQTPGVGIANMVAGAGIDTPYIGNVAVGSRTLELLKVGGPMSNAWAVLHGLCNAARAAGKTPRVFIYSAHGEANANAGTSEASYYTMGMDFYRTLQSYAAQAMNDPAYFAPVILTYPTTQSQGVAGQADREIKKAIKRISEDLPNGVDAGGVYPFPVDVDRTHPTEAGYVLRGEKIGYIGRQIASSGVAPLPVKMTGVTLSGTTFVVTFNRNVVRDDVRATASNLNAANQRDGFEWVDNGTSRAITALTYSGNTVTGTLATAPTGTIGQQVLRIAEHTTTATLTAIDPANIPGSLVRADEVGFASIYDPTYTHYTWASPQSITPTAV